MNSKSPPNELIIYLDRNLGSKIVPEALQKANIRFEIHDDHLAPDAPDEDWVRLCSEKRWIAITKDARIRYNAHIRKSIQDSQAGIFILKANNHTGAQNGELLVRI